MLSQLRINEKGETAQMPVLTGNNKIPLVKVYTNHSNPQVIKQQNLSERASLCTFFMTERNNRWKLGARGSLTVEAAGIVPLFLLAMAVLISFMDMARIQTEQNMKLANGAKQLAMVAYTAKDVVQVPYIDLQQPVAYQVPVSFIPLPKIYINARARVHTWIGNTIQAAEGQEQDLQEMVYVTENGQVYHTEASCTYLDLSIQAVGQSQVSRLRNEYGEKYHACEKCQGIQSGSVVYVTQKSDCYHNTLICSGLKREVKLVPASEVVGMNQCSRCQSGEH